MRALKAIHSSDPAKEILDRAGDLSQFELMGNQVLLGVYIRSNETKLGGSTFYLPDQTVKEDEWQGKAGLVLKKGPTAFVSDKNYDFKGQDVEVGDWVSVWVSDGRKIKVNDQLCRIVMDTEIRMKIPAPDAVY